MNSAGSIRQGQQAGRELWQAQGDRRRVNVGQTERLVSQVGGGALIVVGLARGGLKGLLAAGMGAALLARGTTGHCSLYEAIGMDTSEPEQGPYGAVPAQQGVRVEESIIIDRVPDDIYLFWRDHANLSKFMTDVVEVTSADGIHSHWVVGGPMGLTLEYDAEIHNDEPGRLISWRSLPGAQLATAGTVRFSPAAGGRGTEVRVNQKFDPPGGKLTVGLAKLLGHDPTSVTRENLRRLKQLMEAGEVATISGQPSGRA
ncbi:SRPBCC family protein [Tautonia plasticadhaerens]|uniref:Polyketide cyclase / dehydrase and lipid transport n=1 Tax=Tautonia plasticadhaerens TaxID=2527974 RepID=A0A518HCF0_9BACT|nr:SRPBCC family protein [Tautonia plasticadhaerens]QDV38529.1 Polyketide cyclase / dehydrase and lipid transport [Tautonia plasticadhaerens]